MPWPINYNEEDRRPVCVFRSNNPTCFGCAANFDGTYSSYHPCFSTAQKAVEGSKFYASRLDALCGVCFRVESHLRFTQGGIATRRQLEKGKWNKIRHIQDLRLRVIKKLEQTNQPKIGTWKDDKSDAPTPDAELDMAGYESWIGEKWNARWDEDNSMIFARMTHLQKG